ncbi:MAG: hypothetical protein JWL90_3471 [Chthoniobacteraceae bacterium]|nr:hypothetical protein [Chthoniobacteraceae bacterium]
MLAALRNADSGWLYAGLIVYGLVEIIAGIRWQILLKVQGIHLAWGRVFMLMMTGVFFNFFVPGGTGGDVVKTFYLLKETPGQRSQALLSVLVDRIIGLFSLIVLAGVLIALRWEWLTSSEQTTKYVWTGLAILGASFFGIACSFVITGCGLVHKLPARMPGRDKLAELALAYNAYGRAWRAALGSFGLSILAHLGYFGTFYCAAKAFAATGNRIPSFGEFYAMMPIINTILAMPISFGGLGAREGLFQIFLGNLSGVAPAVAVVISMTGYMLTLFWGLIGGLLYIFYRPSEHARLHEMNKEVAALEHSVAEDEIAMELAKEKRPHR